MTTGQRTRYSGGDRPSGGYRPPGGDRPSSGNRPSGGDRPPGGNRRGGPGGFGRGRRGRNFLKGEDIDYKDVQLMRRFVSERGKLVSGQRLGVTAKNQRRLARAIKRAQHLALVPMAPNHVYVTGSIQPDAPQRPESSEIENEAVEEQTVDAPEVVGQSDDDQGETQEPTEETPEQS